MSSSLRPAGGAVLSSELSQASGQASSPVSGHDPGQVSGHAASTVNRQSLLHPVPATADGRAGALDWALRPRALVLLLAGALCLLPAFFHGHSSEAAAGVLRHLPLLALVLWDATVLLLAAWDLGRLPRTLSLTRAWLATPALGQPTTFTLTVLHASPHAVPIELSDALHPSVAAQPLTAEVLAFPRDPTAVELSAMPGARGDFALGMVFCRLRGSLGLAERWIRVTPRQQVRVYPSAVRAGSEGALPLLNARQIELEKRRLRLRGTGRDFDSLRAYQPGDALRDVSWTASARRGKLITRQFTAERSQQVWVLLDSGRLSQTTVTSAAGTVTTQLDNATSAAILLARAVCSVGDKFGMLAYGRAIRQQLLPGSGAGHLRLLVDQLALVASERGEANHLRAVGRFQQLQRRRSLVIWITEVAETAGRPEIAAAVAEIARHHLALILLLEHPEVHALAESPAEDTETVFAVAAAREMEERRTALVLTLERGGAMVVRTTSAALAGNAIRSYLAIKAKGLL